GALGLVGAHGVDVPEVGVDPPRQLVDEPAAGLLAVAVVALGRPPVHVLIGVVQIRRAREQVELGADAGAGFLPSAQRDLVLAAVLADVVGRGGIVAVEWVEHGAPAHTGVWSETRASRAGCGPGTPQPAAPPARA